MVSPANGRPDVHWRIQSPIPIPLDGLLPSAKLFQHSPSAFVVHTTGLRRSGSISAKHPCLRPWPLQLGVSLFNPRSEGFHAIRQALFASSLLGSNVRKPTGPCFLRTTTTQARAKAISAPYVRGERDRAWSDVNGTLAPRRVRTSEEVTLASEVDDFVWASFSQHRQLHPCAGHHPCFAATGIPDINRPTSAWISGTVTRILSN